MKARIYFQHKDGTEDSLVMAGADADDIRGQVIAEIQEKRGGEYLYSEILEE